MGLRNILGAAIALSIFIQPVHAEMYALEITQTNTTAPSTPINSHVLLNYSIKNNAPITLPLLFTASSEQLVKTAAKDNPCGASLSANQQCNISYTFNAGSEPSLFKGYVSVSYDGRDGYPQGVQITITGNSAPGPNDDPTEPTKAHDATEGINGANVTAIARDPSNPALIALGTHDGGLWISENSGQNWKSQSSPYLNTAHDSTKHPQHSAPKLIAAIAISSTQTLYASTDDYYPLLKSKDFGKHWEALVDNTGECRFYAAPSITIDPHNPDHLFVGNTRGKICETRDGGSTWIKRLHLVTGANGRSSIKISRILFHPTQANILYAATKNGEYNKNAVGVIKSVDAGQTWHMVNSGITPENAESAISVNTLAIDPNNPSTLFAAIEGIGLARTFDGGEHWEPVESPLLPSAISALAFDSTDTTGNTLYVGAAGKQGALSGHVYKTEQARRIPSGLQHWTDISQGMEPNTEGAPTAALAVSSLLIPANSTTLFVTHNGGAGVYRAERDSEYWTASNAGLHNVNIMSIAIAPQEPNTLFAAVKDYGIYKTVDGAAHWTYLAGYAPNNDFTDLAFSQLHLDPIDPNRLYVLVADNSVYRSSDAGTTWHTCNSGLPENNIKAIAIHPHAHNVLMAATEQGLYRTSDYGDHWEQIESRSTQNVVFSRELPDTAYVTHYYGKHLFRSNNTRAVLPTWGNMLTDHLIHIDHIKFASHNPETVYIASNDEMLGVMLTDNNFDTLLSYNEGLSDLDILTMTVDQNESDSILVGTAYGGFVSNDGAKHWKPITQLPLAAIKQIAIPTLSGDNKTKATYAVVDGVGIKKFMD